MTLKITREVLRKYHGKITIAVLMAAIIILVTTSGCGGGGGGVAVDPPVAASTNKSAPKIAKAEATVATCGTPCPANVNIRGSDEDYVTVDNTNHSDAVYCTIECGGQGVMPEFRCDAEDVVKGCIFSSAGTYNMIIRAVDRNDKWESGVSPKSATPVTRVVTVTETPVVIGNNVPVLSGPGVANGGGTAVNENDLVIFTCAVTDPDVADRPTVTVNFDDGTVSTGLSCDAIYHAWTTTGTYHVEFRANDGKSTSAPQTVTITVDDAPATSPSAPRVTTTIPDFVKTTSLSVSGTKDSGTTLESNGISIPVTKNATQWSYTFSLGEGTNEFNLISKNSEGAPSPTKVLAIVKDTTPPKPIVVKAYNASTEASQETCTFQKTLECIPYLSVRGETATKIGDEDAHNDLNRDQLTDNRTTSVSLHTGSNSLRFYCMDAAGNSSGDVTGSITRTTPDGDDDEDPDAPTGSLSISPSNPNVDTAVIASYSCSGDCDSIIIDWGDGTSGYSSAGSGSDSTSHTYTAVGTVTATLTLSGSDGSNSYTQTVDVVASGGGTATGLYQYYTSWSSGGYNDIAQDGDITYAVRDTTNPSGGCIYRHTEGNGTMSACTNLDGMNYSFQTPVSVAACKNDDDKIGVFDSDLGKVVIVRFSSTGATRLSDFSATGGKDSKLECDKDGNWLIADPAAATVRKFNPTGSLQWTYTTGLSNPADVATDSGGNVFIANEGDDRVIRLTPTGSLYTSWGEAGDEEDQFTSIIGIALDGSDKIFVLDGGQHRIKIYSNSGSFLGWFGSDGTGNSQFDTPVAVTASGSGTNSRACIADNGTVNKVKEFHPAP